MFQGIPVGDISAPGLVAVAVLLLMTGLLVPRRTLTDKAKEADRWHEAYEKEREARVTSDAQTAELLELAKTTHSFITAVFNNSERIRQTGDPHASSTKE